MLHAKKYLSALIFSLCFVSILMAKPKKADSVIQEIFSDDEDDAEELEWQILEWEDRNSRYAYKYEVSIESLDPKTQEWIPVNKIQTERNETRIQIQPYLMPGNYRYQVTTFDLFGYPSVESDWTEFNIYEAFQPEVRDVNVDLYFGNTIFLDELNNGVISINGKNLFEPSEGESDINYTEYYLLTNNRGFKAKFEAELLEHDDKNSKAKLQFNLANLDAGTYNLVARDASGLESQRNEKNQLIIKFKKAVDLDISAGWAMPVLLFDQTLPTYMESRLIPVTATAKISLMPFKHMWGYLGMGFIGSYSMHTNMTPDYNIIGNYLTGYLDFVYQYPIYKNKNDMEKRRHIGTVEARAGGGIDYFLNYTFYYGHGVTSKSLNTIAYGFNVGASYQHYFTNRIYAEASLDYQMTFGNNIMVGKVVPALYAGVQL